MESPYFLIPGQQYADRGQCFLLEVQYRVCVNRAL